MEPVTLINASRDGRCPKCRCSIGIGDLIGKEGRNPWVCHDCALEPLRDDLMSELSHAPSRTQRGIECEIATDRRMRNAAGLADLTYIVLANSLDQQMWQGLDETVLNYAPTLGHDLGTGWRPIACFSPRHDGRYQYTELVDDPDTDTTQI